MKLYPYVITGPIILPCVDYLLTRAMLASERRKAARAEDALDRLERLHDLLRSGAITQDEYNKLKTLFAC